VRVRAPVDVATKTRFCAVRRDLDEHDSRPWQLRVELDLDDSSLVEIAEELLTSEMLSARPIVGKGSVLRLTVEQAGWLRHKLDVLLIHVDSRPSVNKDSGGDIVDKLNPPEGWLTSRQVAARLGIKSRAFWPIVDRHKFIPVHRDGHVSYWNEEQVLAIESWTTGGTIPVSGSVRRV
jgi:hypothetical protein